MLIDRPTIDRPTGRHLAPRKLFLISFVILFLELASIRWLNATVAVLAYFNNLILISCFFGLGLGCLLASRRIVLVRLFGPALLFLVLAVLFLHRYGIQITYEEDFIFAPNPGYFSDSLLRVSLSALLGFFINVAFFVFLGQELGKQLSAVEDPLRAYAYDIAGSFFGVLAYAALAWVQLPPHAWYAIGALVLLSFLQDRKWWFAVSVLAALVAILLMRNTYPEAKWSPYYKVETETIPSDGGSVGFRILVDNHRIQDALDLGPNLRSHPLKAWIPYYEVPYHLIRPKKVLILGAGSGNEAVMALRFGAEEVHAVEIDPVIAGFGRSRHPNLPYRREGVKVIVDDARSYVSTTDEKYDLVVMSALDSHKQIAGMSSLRLESFVYTSDAFEQMKRLIRPGGVFCLNVSSYRPWIGERIYWSLAKGFGSEPKVLTSAGIASYSVAYVYAPDSYFERDLLPEGSRVTVMPPYPWKADILLATDNWPHLYLKENRVPTLYLVIISGMVILSVLLVLGVEPAVRRPNLHFFFLGAGFMLLETRSVTQMALLFGSTWNVNSIVFASILLTIFVSNYLVLKERRPGRAASYALLLVTLIALFFFPFKSLLGLPPILRLGAAAFVVGLPIAWASFIFSISFKGERAIGKAFGSNLLGVVFGGCIEYSSSIWGLNCLYLLAIGLYAASAIFIPRGERVA